MTLLLLWLILTPIAAAAAGWLLWKHIKKTNPYI